MPGVELFDVNDDFAAAVALGLMSGIDRVASAGFSGALAATTETDISGLGVDTIPLPANAGEAMTVWSTDAGDTTQQIQVEGLGPDGIAQDPETITLNGTTAVALPGLWSRINFVTNVSDTPVAGTINVGTQPTTIYSNILPANQLSKQAHYSVAAGFTLITPSVIASFRKSTGPDTGVLISTLTKRFTQTFYYRTIGFELVRGGNSSAQFGDEYPSGLTGPFDVKVSANSDAAGSEVLARINGLLVRRA